jgi:hypothetical protein
MEPAPMRYERFAMIFRPVHFGLFFLCGLVMAPLALAQTSIAFRLSIPEDITRIQFIAPGAIGDFAISVTSESATSGNAVIGGRYVSQAATLAEYVFSSNDPVRCALPVTTPPSPFMGISFGAGPIAPGATLTCRYRIARAVASVNDMGFDICAPIESAGSCGFGGDNSFRFGALPDLALSVQQVLPTPADSSEPVFRLQLTNNSNQAIQNRIVTTDCREFNGGIFDPMPYVLESDFPGGCATTQGEICLLLTGQRHLSFGYNSGPIPAGGSASCLVRLRHHPDQPSTPSIDLYFVDYSLSDEYPLLVLTNGGIAIDPNVSNDRATLALAGTGAASPIPMSPGGLLALALTLLLFGMGMRWRGT